MKTGISVAVESTLIELFLYVCAGQIDRQAQIDVDKNKTRFPA